MFREPSPSGRMAPAILVSAVALSSFFCGTPSPAQMPFSDATGRRGMRDRKSTR